MATLRALLLMASIVCAAPAVAQPSGAWDDPWQSSPLVRDLADRIIFQLTCDGDSVLPVMAAGAWEPRVLGTPQFADGLVGRALVAGDGSGRIVYPRGPNASMAGRGAVSLWICPVQWTRDNGGNTTFLTAANGAFYLQRQGPAHNDQGIVTRYEGVQFLIRGEVTGNQTLMVGTDKWPNGRWRLLVANWSLPTMSFSIDGGEFQTTGVDAVPEDAYFGDLAVGASGGELTLIDEITIYKRPLTREEVSAIYDTFKPQATEVEQ